MFKIRGSDIKDFFCFTNPHLKGSGHGATAVVKFFLDQHHLNTKEKLFFIFDNDIAGNNALKQCINTNQNILLKCLPNLNQNETKNMQAFYSGKILPNYIINGQAVAIESFLDLTFGNYPPFINVSDDNQGKFQYKEKYSKKFVNLRLQDYNKYKFKKIDKLIDFIFNNSFKLFK